MPNKEKELMEKLNDTAIDGAAIALDPDEAEALGAVEEEFDVQDVIDAAYDDEA